MLKAALLDRGFVESVSNPCVYINKKLIALVYVDDCILISKKESAITEFVQSLHNGPENFVFTKEGSLESYLGVCMSKLPGGRSSEIFQSFLIDRIIKAIGFDLAATNGVRNNVPVGYSLLNKDMDGPPRKTK